MKKILLLIFIIILIILIYVFTNKKSNLIFSIGNDTGDINYTPNNYRVTDIILDIENNINIDGFDIQNLLVRATRINIDLSSFITLKDYPSILSQITDLETLLKLIRKYTKEEICILLLEEKNILAEYANKKIILLSKKYDIMVVR